MPEDIQTQMNNEQRFQHLNDELGHVSTKVAALETGLAGVISTVNNLSTQIGGRFDQVFQAIKDNQPKGINLFALGSLLVGVVGVGAAFVTMRIQPVERNIHNLQTFQMQEYDREREQAITQGTIEERSRWLIESSGTAQDVNAVVHRMEGRLDALERRLGNSYSPQGQQ